MNSGIYMWTSPSGKSYIGQAVDLNHRRREFTKFYQSYAGGRIDNARKKYNNESNWKYEVLEYCSIDKLDEREIYYIGLYNTFKNGYNMTKGGGGSLGYSKSDEQKENFSRILRKIHSDPNSKFNSIETRKKQSDTHKKLRADPNSKYNSVEIRYKRSVYMTEKWKNSEYRERMILSQNTDKLKQERSERMIKLRKDPNSAYNSIETRKKLSNTLKKLREDPNSIYNSEDYIYKHLTICRSEKHIEKLRVSHSNPIIQLDINNNFIREWISASEAQRETKNNEKFNVCGILRCCNGKQTIYKKYKWIKSEDYYKQKEDD